MFPGQLYRVTDTGSNLEASLTVLRASDGGASAIFVDLHNSSNNQDVILKVYADISAFIMLTVTDNQGSVLSKPAKKFNSSEERHTSLVRIPRASSHRWRVPIASQLSESAVPEQGMRGRLVANLALLFDRISGVEKPAEADFKSSLLTLYDMDVLFTRAALANT